MKLRVHYKYGSKVKKKDFGTEMTTELLHKMGQMVSEGREEDSVITLDDAKCPGFSVPARDIVLMEVID